MTSSLLEAGDGGGAGRTFDGVNLQRLRARFDSGIQELLAEDTTHAGHLQQAASEVVGRAELEAEARQAEQVARSCQRGFPLSQPDLLIGRGAPPLNSQQPSGHRRRAVHYDER